MSLLEIQEGVKWEQQDKNWLGYSWFSELEEESRVAHRRCWKDLKEWERKSIRQKADVVPKSMGQMV